MHTVERVLLLVGEVLQRVLEEYLTHEGVHVITCHSEDHLRAMVNPARDVVVLEYWRRGDDQLNDDARRDLARVGGIAPTVLLTTHYWARSARACELGISGIVELPVEMEALWAAVRRAIP